MTKMTKEKCKLQELLSSTSVLIYSTVRNLWVKSRDDHWEKYRDNQLVPYFFSSFLLRLILLNIHGGYRWQDETKTHDFFFKNYFLRQWNPGKGNLESLWYFYQGNIFKILRLAGD